MPLHDGRFSKCSHFSNISCFFERFFAQHNSKWFVEWILTCFLEFYFLTQSDDFAKAIAFAWWPIFKMLSFLEYFVFFRAVFCTAQLWMICRVDFDMFFGILIFDPKWGFCKGYSLCMMADFQMLSFLEYFVFFRAVFCTAQLEMICRMDFDMFFGILIFDPKWGFCKGYSLCMMADFQNALIFRIFCVFSSGFLHSTTRNDL